MTQHATRNTQLRAGVCEIELKPELGYVMGDGAWQAKGYLTPLYTKALVLSNGMDEVAIVTLDATGMDRCDTMRTAELASQRCGVPANGILISCSHTHVAPSMRPSVHGGRQMFNPYWNAAAKERERAWRDKVVETIATAICEAKAHLQEASVGVVTADLPWLSFNRRRHTRTYGIWTHWMKIPPNQAHRPEGPTDPELGLFVVRAGPAHASRPLCLLWNFSGHNSFNFGDQYSADLAYTVQAALDERLGEHVPCLYTPGCGANTNYYDYGQEGGLEKATDGLASAIIATYREACTLPEVRLGSRKAELFLARRDTSRYWWKHDIHAKLPKWDQFGQHMLDLLQAEARDSTTVQFDVTALRIGQVALVGLPGEFFVEFGLAIKERSPFRHTYVATYTNGHAGYVATRRAFVGGSYEAWPVLAARVGREGGYLMVDKALELLEELHAE